MLNKLYDKKDNNEWLFYGFLFYLVGCFTNPNLFSIVGMVPFGLIFAHIRCNKYVSNKAQAN
jgi:hypothetical protein